MIDFRLGRHALGVCVGIAMLAGCGGSKISRQREKDPNLIRLA
jgi:GMP synthase-like glutamine amidotransferase